MTRYIKYNINAIEDIKMGSQGSQKDNEYALNYIAGSTIRGAYIGRYIMNNSISCDISKDENLRKKLLTGIRFLNAYPLKKNRRAIPFPCCYYADKKEINKYNSEKKYKMPIISEFEEDIPEDFKRVLTNDFCLLSSDSEMMEGVSVDKIFNLHVTTREDNGNLFRYEAIKKGQIFQGIIAIETDNDDDVNDCIKTLENAVVYLGGSKGSGYGRCIINDVKVIDKNPEMIINQEESDYEGEFYVIALSDIISLNSFGQIIGYIDENLLKNSLELEDVNLKHSAMQTQIISGYNSKWKCHTPQIVGIKAGSIFKYSYKGNIKANNIRRLQDLGIGERLEDGYGRIIITYSLDYNSIRRCNDKDKNEILGEINKDSEKQLQKIIDGIYKNAVEKEIDNKLVNLSKGFNNKLGRNQIGKLIENSINARNKSIKEGKAYFIEYLEHIKAKELNRKVFNQYEDSSINGIRLFEYLTNIINNSDNIEIFKREMQFNVREISIGNVQPKITNEYVFKTNMIFLERFFRYVLRNGGER